MLKAKETKKCHQKKKKKPKKSKKKKKKVQNISWQSTFAWPTVNHSAKTYVTSL
jgi:hypothetical protein